ncbi:MAG: flagellar filament capping protein FliD [Castellaniella sp.]|nr:flagellar filament capping protein FliD [Castellaniella sp.]
MATISSLGISGLPLNDLLTNLQKNESQVLTVIQNRQIAAQSKLSAYGKLKDAISAFQKTANALTTAGTFGAIAATPGSDAISATATSQAIPGQYSIQVDSLASTQTMVFGGRADRTTNIGTDGTLNLTINGKTQSIDLTGKSTSLDGLVSAINGDPNIGVNATLVNDGSGTPYRLLFTSRQTGTANAVTSVSVTNNATLDQFLGYDATTNANNNGNAGFSVQAATDAKAQINGIAITSSTNTIDNAIDGVTLTLNKTTTTATSLSLAQDSSVAKKAIQDFVKSYNDLLGTINTLTAYDVGSQTSSALTGDSVARSVQTRMRDAVSGGFDASLGTNLGQIGITTDPKTGQLQIDDTKLSQALASNNSGVKSLFTSSTGIGTRVSATADAFTQSGGTLTAATDGLNKTITDIQNQYNATSDRINQRMDTYRKQFSQLDAMVSQMNSLGSYLTQQLGALNGTSTKK